MFHPTNLLFFLCCDKMWHKNLITRCSIQSFCFSKRSLLDKLKALFVKLVKRKRKNNKKKHNFSRNDPLAVQFCDTSRYLRIPIFHCLVFTTMAGISFFSKSSRGSKLLHVKSAPPSSKLCSVMVRAERSEEFNSFHPFICVTSSQPSLFLSFPLLSTSLCICL